MYSLIQFVTPVHISAFLSVSTRKKRVCACSRNIIRPSVSHLFSQTRHTSLQRAHIYIIWGHTVLFLQNACRLNVKKRRLFLIYGKSRLLNYVNNLCTIISCIDTTLIVES